MIANLGMYDMPAVQPANDRFWQAIRARLGYGPETLTRDRDPAVIWPEPDMLLGQTCGLPYRTDLFSRTTRIGTPDYGLPGCPPGHYCSLIVVQADAPERPDLTGGVLACNEERSQSGWAGPLAHLTARGMPPGDVLATGAHVHSAYAVAEGRADVAGIDALTWAMLCDHDDVTAQLRVIDTTTPTPGLPYITNIPGAAPDLRRAIAAAILDLEPRDRQTLRLRALVEIDDADYLAVDNPPSLCDYRASRHSATA